MFREKQREPRGLEVISKGVTLVNDFTRHRSFNLDKNEELSGRIIDRKKSFREIQGRRVLVNVKRFTMIKLIVILVRSSFNTRF